MDSPRPVRMEAGQGSGTAAGVAGTGEGLQPLADAGSSIKAALACPPRQRTIAVVARLSRSKGWAWSAPEVCTPWPGLSDWDSQPSTGREPLMGKGQGAGTPSHQADVSEPAAFHVYGAPAGSHKPCSVLGTVPGQTLQGCRLANTLY